LSWRICAVSFSILLATVWGLLRAPVVCRAASACSAAWSAVGFDAVLPGGVCFVEGLQVPAFRVVAGFHWFPGGWKAVMGCNEGLLGFVGQVGFAVRCGLQVLRALGGACCPVGLNFGGGAG